METSQHTKPVALIGYSGHGFVAADALLSAGWQVKAYCDREEKILNPFNLQYLGAESSAQSAEWFTDNAYFISIGDNNIRQKVYTQLMQHHTTPVNAIHRSAIISPTAKLQDGILVAAGAVINPLSEIGKGVICNTSSSIDHECIVGNFSHIAPGAILCGNVTVGFHSFIGAGSVVRQGITIGNNVMIGAGCIVVKNIPDNAIMVGNPQKELLKK